MQNNMEFRTLMEKLFNIWNLYSLVLLDLINRESNWGSFSAYSHNRAHFGQNKNNLSSYVKKNPSFSNFLNQ
jgi:hypothetical protein